jgi:hypothetical protein
LPSAIAIANASIIFFFDSSIMPSLEQDSR